MNKHKQRNAMTLLEVTIVLLIVGIMAAVASPRFAAAMRATQVHAAAIQLAGHVRYVRRVAINESRTTEMVFEPSRGAYSSTNVSFPDRLDQNLNVNIQQAFDPSLELSTNLTGSVLTGLFNLSFDLEGAPYSRGLPLQNGMITISSPDVPDYHILIADSTGYVTLLSDSELNNRSGNNDGGGSLTPSSTVGPASLSGGTSSL